ncbi:Metallo-dependent phosphatase [Thozetella sp. PMI_491]|nr:Metallo-dependent phosphatase [Thozetella sp. PMI_491]
MEELRRSRNQNKELYLHAAQRTAWLRVARTTEAELIAEDLVVTAIKVGGSRPDANSKREWEGRPGGIWLLRRAYSGDVCGAVADLDVLFGADAVDPRMFWRLIPMPLQLDSPPEVPVARLSVRHAGTRGGRDDMPRIELRARKDGTFKIVQISDTHMVADVGMCRDASDARGQPLPELEADPLTVKLVEEILDVEQPDLVILTGDQVHHDVTDTQSALFKVVAPLVKRSIPFAAVFGNHDDEGTYALSREAQMKLLDEFPTSLCQAGPAHVDGVGNYYLQIFPPAPEGLPIATLYFVDSHGQMPSDVRDPDYIPISQNQIDWFMSTSRRLRKEREKTGGKNATHLALAFWHIPFPKFSDAQLVISGGCRREPTEGPSYNSHFYDALVEEGIAAVGCGHDHVNDFCGLRPGANAPLQDDGIGSPLGPWLCYGGGAGFGGYCSYDGTRYHRRARIWALDTLTGGIKTWKRVEYVDKRVDELVLVEDGAVIAPSPPHNGRAR